MISPEQFEKYHVEYWPEVCAYCTAHMESADDAEDAALEVSVRKWVAIGRHGPSRAGVGTWLLGNATRPWIELHGKRGQRPVTARVKEAARRADRPRRGAHHLRL